MYEDLKIIYPETSIIHAIDLSGKQFGNWTVLYKTTPGGTVKNHYTRWVCRCSCENQTIKPVAAYTLIHGKSKSCGCLTNAIITGTKDKDHRIRDKNGRILYKKCQACHEMLPIEHFYKQRTTFDGYAGVCKQCANETVQYRYAIYRKSAKSRDKLFTITQEDFSKITSQPCYYCGGFSKKDKNGKSYNGLDRVDTKKGYELSNVVACCETCNKMKLDYTKKYFLDHVKKIFLYNMRKENI